MTLRKHKREVDDKVAAQALRGGSRFGPEPTHSAMEATEENPDANATDAEPDSDDYYGGGN